MRFAKKRSSSMRFFSIFFLLGVVLFCGILSSARAESVQGRFFRVSTSNWSINEWFQLLEVRFVDNNSQFIFVSDKKSSIEPVSGYGLNNLCDETYEPNNEFAVTGPSRQIDLDFDLGAIYSVKAIQIYNDGVFGAKDATISVKSSEADEYKKIGSFSNLGLIPGQANENELIFDSKILINEIYSGTESWVEIINRGTMNRSLKGYYLDFNTQKFKIDSDLIITANSFVLVMGSWQKNFSEKTVYTGYNLPWFDYVNVIARTSGRCILYSDKDEVVDCFAWGEDALNLPADCLFSGAPSFLPVKKSLSRFSTENDTDSGMDFKESLLTPLSKNQRYYTISGKIRNSLLQAVPDVMIIMDTTPVAFTDEWGSYTINDVIQGAHLLRPLKKNKLFDPVAKSVDVNSNITNQDFLSRDYSNSFSISGYVKNMKGIGVQDINVKLKGVVDTETGTLNSGFFSFTGLPSGRYYVSPESAENIISPGGLVVRLLEDTVIPDFTIDISDEIYIIQGRIVNVMGAPVKGVKVFCPPYEGITDDNGLYSITGLYAAHFNITPSAADMIFEPSEIQVLASEPGNYNFTAIANSSSVLEGKITYLNDNLAVHNLSILLQQNGRDINFVIPDATGKYFFTGIEYGVYQILPISEEFLFEPSTVTIPMNNTIGSFDFQAWIPERLFLVSGIVKNIDGTALPGVEITLDSYYKAITDIDGYYEFKGLDGGDHYISAAIDSHLVTPDEVEFNLGTDRTDLNFTAKTRAVFSINCDTKSIYDIPESNINLKLEKKDSGSWHHIADSLTQDGSCKFSNLSKGKYKIIPEMQGYVFSPSFYYRDTESDLDFSEGLSTCSFRHEKRLMPNVTMTGRYLRLQFPEPVNSKYFQLNEIAIYGCSIENSTRVRLEPERVVSNLNAVNNMELDKLFDLKWEFNSDTALEVSDVTPEILIDLNSVHRISDIIVFNDGLFGSKLINVFVSNSVSGPWTGFKTPFPLKLHESRAVSNSFSFEPHGILLSEILEMGDNGIEIVNLGPYSVNLEGFRLFGGGLNHTFGDLWFEPKSLITLWGGTNPIIDSLSNHYMSGVSIEWGTTGDHAAFYDRTGACIDFVRWGSDWTPAPLETEFNGINPLIPDADQSLSRNFLYTDTNSGTDWTLGENTPSSTQSRRYTIGGTITDIIGRPHASVAISLISQGNRFYSAISDGDGKYSFSNIPSCGYAVVPSSPSLEFTPQSLKFVLMKDNGIINFKGITRQKRVRIKGHVVLKSTYEPIENARVTMNEKNYVTADSSGNWELSVFEPGQLKIRCFLSGYTFSPEQQFYNITAENISVESDFELNFTGAPENEKINVAGKVQFNAAPLEGVTLFLSPDNISTITDQYGNFSFQDVSPGTGDRLKDIAPVKSGYLFSPEKVSISVSGFDYNGIIFSSEQSYQAGGEIFDDNSNPLSQVRVELYKNDVSAGTSQFLNNLFSTATGKFLFSELSQGQYTVKVSKPGWEFQNSVSYFSLPPHKYNFQFTGTKVLTDYTISGVVTFNSNALSDINIFVNEIEKSTTGIDGGYSFKSPAGEELKISPVKSGYSFTPEFIEFRADSDHNDINFQAEKRYVISGKVASEGGYPVPGVKVSCTKSGDSLAIEDITDLNGTFDFLDLRAGDYDLTLSADNRSILPSALTCTVGPSVTGLVFISGLVGGNPAIHVDPMADIQGNGTESYPFNSLSTALDKSDSGDVIQIFPGVIQGNYVLPFGVTLRGAGPDSTIIMGPSGSFVIQVSASSKLENLKVQGSGALSQASGILATQTDPIIQNCIVTDCRRGIWLKNCSATVNNCTFYNNNLVDFKSQDSLGTTVENTIIGSSEVSGMNSFNYILSDNYSLYPYSGVGCLFEETGLSEFPILYDLKSGSPGIDSGNPDISMNDLDSSRNNMGAFGGPDAAIKEIQIVTASNIIIDNSLLNGSSAMIDQNGNTAFSFDAPQDHINGYVEFFIDLGKKKRLYSSLMVLPTNCGFKRVEYKALNTSDFSLAGISTQGSGGVFNVSNDNSTSQTECIMQFAPEKYEYIYFKIMDFYSSTCSIIEILPYGINYENDMPLSERVFFDAQSTIQPYQGFGFDKLQDGLKRVNSDFAIKNSSNNIRMTLLLSEERSITSLTIDNDSFYGFKNVEVRIPDLSATDGSGEKLISLFTESQPSEDSVKRELLFSEYQYSEDTLQYTLVPYSGNGVFNTDRVFLDFTEFHDKAWFQLNELSLFAARPADIIIHPVIQAVCDKPVIPGFGPERLIDGSMVFNNEFAVRNSGVNIRITLDLGSLKEVSGIEHFNDGIYGGSILNISGSSLADGSDESVLSNNNLIGNNSITSYDRITFTSAQIRYLYLDYTAFYNPKWFQLKELRVFNKVLSKPLEAEVQEHFSVASASPLNSYTVISKSESAISKSGSAKELDLFEFAVCYERDKKTGVIREFKNSFVNQAYANSTELITRAAFGETICLISETLSLKLSDLEQSATLKNLVIYDDLSNYNNIFSLDSCYADYFLKRKSKTILRITHIGKGLIITISREYAEAMFVNGPLKQSVVRVETTVKNLARRWRDHFMLFHSIDTSYCQKMADVHWDLLGYSITEIKENQFNLSKFINSFINSLFNNSMLNPESEFVLWKALATKPEK